MNESITDMSGLSEEKKREIVARLRDRGVPKACPMCGHNHWILADGYVKSVVQNHVDDNYLRSMRMNDRFLPLVTLICTQCGFASHHSVGILGLLVIQEEKPETSGENK